MPLRYQEVVLTHILSGDLPHGGVDSTVPVYSVNFEGMITDLFLMELGDTLIGLAMRSERKLIRGAGAEVGALKYGNASTWARRIYRALESRGASLMEDPEDFR